MKGKNRQSFVWGVGFIIRLHPHFIIQSTEEDLTEKKDDISRRQKPQDTIKRKNLKLSASELLLNLFNVNAILFLCLYKYCLFIQDGTLEKFDPQLSWKAFSFLSVPLTFSGQTNGRHHKAELILREILLPYNRNLKHTSLILPPETEWSEQS